MGPQSDSYYDGSRTFLWITELTGIPIDLINFTVTQLVALLLAPLYRTILHPARAKSKARHVGNLVVGLVMGYFAFGRQSVHLAGLPAICYLVICNHDPRTVHSVVLLVSMIYLSCIHIHRQIYDYGSSTLDITGPLMVIVQKITSLAYSLHDGLTRKEQELSATQKYYAIRAIPSVLDYFAYIFQFHVLMAGPVIYYRDYTEFINGHNFSKYLPPSKNYIKNKDSNTLVSPEPSPIIVVLKKIMSSVLCALIFLSFSSTFPILRIREDAFVDTKTVFSQMCYLSIVTLLVRFKYYHAWLMSDAICNLSGLGFNGFTPDGTPKWDLVSNVDVINFEFGSSLRETIDSWNKGTNIWLRYLVYERRKSYRTILTFSLSSFWHGFYPGYYLTFASAALFTFASRAVRHSFIRHYFQGSAAMRSLYDFLSMVTTRIIVTYITFSFVILEFWPSIRIYRNMYFCFHLLGLSAILILPSFRMHTHRQPTPIKNQFSKVASNGVSIGIQG